MFQRALVVGCAFGLAGHASAAEPARPNILFIFSDDHAAHAISAYGSKINQTPHIDRLARQGMIFRNCFCTNSICAPSRAVVLTGKHSHLNGMITNSTVFDGSQQTCPKLLQKAGYQTAIIGKWHLGSDPTGFDHWSIFYGLGVYYNPPFKTPEGRQTYTGYTTDILTDLTLDWLKKQRDPSKPFLLMCHHKAPHREWDPDPKHFPLFKDMMIPEPSTLFDKHEGHSSATQTQTMTVASELNDRDLKLTPPPGLNPEQRKAWDAFYEPENRAFREAHLSGDALVRWKYQRYIKDYLRCVASVDDSVGKLLDYLDQSGLAKNTVVIYSSDQGFFLGDRGWFDKRWMYEESLRMPLLIRWPGVTKPGSENRDLVQNLDFAETFLDMAGAPIPADMQGRSLAPLLGGTSPADWRKAIYYQYFDYPAVHNVQRHYGIRTDRFKLIHYYLINEWELFDLKQDPGEVTNLYSNPDHASQVKKLKVELAGLRVQYRAEGFKEPPVSRPVQPGKAKQRANIKSS